MLITQADFQKKYPHVVFKQCADLTADAANIEKAKKNIQHLFDGLPEEQRIVLNQMGLHIELNNAHNDARRYSKNMFHKLVSLDAATSHIIRLDVKLFSSFEYSPEPVQNGWQRKAQSTFNEEAAHACFMRLCSLPHWRKAVHEDFKHDNQHRDALLDFHRGYSAYVTDDGQMIMKSALEKYLEQAEQKGIEKLDELAHELPPEIIHSRNFLNAALVHGGKGTYGSSLLQRTFDFYAPELSGVPKDEKDQAINSIIQRALPNSFPIFKDFETRLMRQAEDIKINPDAYPVLGEITNIGYLQRLLNRNPNKWNKAFEGFGSQQQIQH